MKGSYTKKLFIFKICKYFYKKIIKVIHRKPLSKMPFLTHPVADNFSFQPFKKTIFVFFKQKGSLRRKTLLKLIYEEHSEFLHYSPY